MQAASRIAALIALLSTVGLVPRIAAAQTPDAAGDKPLVTKAAQSSTSQTGAPAKPDKDQYWLLNPVPADLMRPFITDRPTKANVPYTVDAGHFQYETDLVSFTRFVSGSTRTDTLLIPNPTLKVGLTNNADLEVNVPFGGVHAFDTSTGASSTLWGIGDTIVRSKINLWGNDGGDTAAAVIPYIKAPSAPIGFGNGAVEGGLIAPFGFNLPNNYLLLLVPEVDALKDSAGGGRHANYVLDVNLSREVIKNVTAYAEVWMAYNADPTQKATLASLDVAVQWLCLPNTQIDVGANFGITSATPLIQVYAGLSQRF